MSKPKNSRIEVRAPRELRAKYEKAAKKAKQTISSVVVKTLEANEPVTN